MRQPVRTNRIISHCFATAVLCLSVGHVAQAQDQSPPTQEAPAPAPPPAATSAPDQAAKPFTQEQLRKLLAPIALYSDSLLAQVLPASAYPVDIVSASRWLDKNQPAVAKGDYSGADAERWDPSVKALLRFPTVMQKMNTDIDWTKDLGDAFVAEPEDVAAMIQTLRKEAEASGALKSSVAQTVSTEKQGDNDVVVIRDAEPGIVYVPTYDPVAVYQPGNNLAATLLTFGLGVATAAIISNNYWNWNSGWAYPGRWAGYPGYRRSTNIVIRNTDINIRNRWQPNRDRFQPSNRVQQAITRQGGTIRNGRIANLPRANLRPAARGAGVRNFQAGRGRVARGGGPRFNRGGRLGRPRAPARRFGRRR